MPSTFEWILESPLYFTVSVILFIFVVSIVELFLVRCLLILLFSCQVIANSLHLHGLQHGRLLCPSPSPGIFSHSCSLSLCYHPTISSSVIPFSSRPWTFPASRSFPMSQLFTPSDRRIGAAASVSVLLINIQGWFPFGLTGSVSLLSKCLSRVFSSTSDWKYQLFGAQPFLPSKTDICTWLLGKPQLWMYGPLSAMWCLCFLICCLGIEKSLEW